MVETSRKVIYALAIMVTILVAVAIYNTLASLNARNLAYLYWESGVATIVLLCEMLLSFKFASSPGQKNGMLITYGIILASLFISLLFSPYVAEVDKMSFYFHLSISMSVVILVGMVGNIAALEKRPDEGFDTSVYSRNAKIKPKMLLPAFFAAFFIMMGFIMVSGTTFINYPSFSAASAVGAVFGSFGVADPENMDFMVLPYAVMMLILFVLKVPRVPSQIVSVLVGATTFTAYHSVVYATNAVALSVVFGFGLTCLITYAYFGTIVIMGALHISNNLFGAIFKASAVGMSAFSSEAVSGGNIFTPIVLMVVATAGVLLFIRWAKNKYKVKI